MLAHRIRKTRLIQKWEVMVHKRLSLLFLMVIVAVCTLVASRPSDTYAAAKTDSYIENNLQYGISTAIAMDYNNINAGGLDLSSVYTITPCNPRLLNEFGYATQSGNTLYANGLTGSARAGISVEGKSANYRNDSWVSYKDKPNVLQTPVAADPSNIPLQVNGLSFTCRTFADPQPNAGAGRGTCSMTGSQWASTPTGWIKNKPATIANVVNLDTGSHKSTLGKGESLSAYKDPKSNECFVNWKIWMKTRPSKFEVTSGLEPGQTGSIDYTASDTNVLTITRDEESRFWLANPLDILLKVNKPFTDDATIKIKMYYKRQNSYHATKDFDDGHGPINTQYGVCYMGEDDAGTATYSTTSPFIVPWNRCQEREAEFTFTIKINPTGPQWETTGQTTVSPTGTISVGGKADWTHRVTNLPTSKQRTDNISYIVQQKIGSGGWSNVGAPGNFGQIVAGNFKTTNGSYTAQPGDVGKQICQRLQWNPWKDGLVEPMTTAEKCVTVAANPYLQAWGHDIRVGSANNTGSNKSSGIFGTASNGNGSWGEYGLFAPGSITNFASGHGLHNSGSSNCADWSKLTFANTGLGSCPLGNFAPSASLDQTPYQAIDKYFTAANGYTVTNESSASSAGLSGVSGTKIIKTNGNFVVDQDINYQNTGDVNNLPQVIIIARNIMIQQNVSRVDAWLLAENTIDTCSDVPNNRLTINVCNAQLKINGPVMAKQLNLKRTMTPADSEKDRPAEIINLRSDAHMWTYYQSKKAAKLRTSYIRELPPRF